MKPQVNIYTDGSCYPNPGTGGWAAILLCDGREKVVTGGELNTTNNRMELRAVLEGLRALKKPCEVSIYTDSTLVMGWLSGAFIQRDPVIAGMCRSILDAADLGQHDVRFVLVKGHSGNIYNERCDQLALKERQYISENNFSQGGKSYGKIRS